MKSSSSIFLSRNWACFPLETFRNERIFARTVRSKALRVRLMLRKFLHLSMCGLLVEILECQGLNAVNKSELPPKLKHNFYIWVFP